MGWFFFSEAIYNMDMRYSGPLSNGYGSLKVEPGQTSLLAYLDLKRSGELGRQEALVFEALKHLGRASDRMIEARTHLDINAVTGRRNGLLRKGYILLDGVDECAIRHNTVKYWRTA
jgi:hypothetical protein